MPPPDIHPAARAGTDKYDPFNPACKECAASKRQQLHVITHECLEGDALRCVIEVVDDNVPLEVEDYIRVGDVLRWIDELQSDEEKSKPTQTKSKLPAASSSKVGGSVMRPASSEATVSSSKPVVSKASVSPSAVGSSRATGSFFSGIASISTPGSSAKPTAVPTVIVVTATADDGSKTFITTKTLGGDKSTPATIASSSSGSSPARSSAHPDSQAQVYRLDAYPTSGVEDKSVTINALGFPKHHSRRQEPASNKHSPAYSLAELLSADIIRKPISKKLSPQHSDVIERRSIPEEKVLLKPGQTLNPSAEFVNQRAHSETRDGLNDPGLFHPVLEHYNEDVSAKIGSAAAVTALMERSLESEYSDDWYSVEPLRSKTSTPTIVAAVLLPLLFVAVVAAVVAAVVKRRKVIKEKDVRLMEQ